MIKKYQKYYFDSIKNRNTCIENGREFPGREIKLQPIKSHKKRKWHKNNHKFMKCLDRMSMLLKKKTTEKITRIRAIYCMNECWSCKM